MSVKQLRVLDAGCGRSGSKGIPEGAHVTGIDVDGELLAANDRLDERLVGDLQTHPLGSRFDLIICRDVLEHLPDPLAALANMAGALLPGGSLRISVPHVFAPKSLVAKATPHWFHIWFYRRVMGKEWAGRPGYPPFRCYLRWSLRPSKLTREARRLGLVVDSYDRYTGGGYANRGRVLRWLAQNADYELVLRRPAA
jgi:SAM-dependent methyltransferase